MIEDRNEKIDKLIKEALKIENPSLGFSDKIMQRIATSEVEKEIAFRTIMQKYAMNSPSANFTDKVMLQLEKDTSTSFVYTPVIGKKVWMFITFFISLIVAYAFFNLNGQDAQIDFFSQIMTKINHSFSFQALEALFSPIFALGLFTLSMLLGLDYFLHNRSNSHRTNIL